MCSALSLFSDLTKGIRHTFKTVWHNFAQYLCFFVAIFAVETVIGTMCFAYCANSQHIDSTVNGIYTIEVETEEGIEEYICHMRVERLEGSAYTDFFNLTGTYSIENSCPFLHIDYESYAYPGGKRAYTANVTLKEPLEDNAKAFIKQFVSPLIEDHPNIKTVYTPAYNAESYHSELLWEHITSLLTVFVISVAALMLLYSLRLNHFQFTYGVYMAFGADFKKLFSTAIGEMSAVSAATFIPATAMSYLITTLVLSWNGVKVSFALSAVGVSLLLNAAIVAAAIYYPMKLTSRKSPVSLIATQDNSNLVTSPKVSFKIFGSAFPFKYELFSALRFKKYFFKLLISASAFCAVFVCGAYLASMSDTDLSKDASAFSLIPEYQYVEESKDYGAYLNNYESIKKIADSIDGIKSIRIDNGIAAAYSFSHILIKAENNNGAIDYIVDSRENRDFKFATADYRYTAVNKLMLDTLIESGACSFDGDPYAVLQSGANKLIISESIFNDSVFKFKPGDTVIVAVYVPNEDSTAPSVSDTLESLIQNCDFSYKEYTVAAVVHGLPESGAITLGMCAEDCKAITGVYPISTVDIYTSKGSAISDAEALRPQLLKRVGESGLSNWSLSANDEFALLSLRSERGQSKFVRIFSCILLVISPLVWMFSQIMFYKKREREMYTLRAFGAFESDIKKIYMYGGMFVSVGSFVITVAVSLVAALGMYGISNTLAAYGFKTLTGAVSTFYKFEISVPLLILSAVISALCGSVSAGVPYLLDRRRVKKENSVKDKNLKGGL